MQNVSVYPEGIELCDQATGKENAIANLFTGLAIDSQKILAGIWWKMRSGPLSVYRLHQNKNTFKLWN